MSEVKILILRGPGTNCDGETAYAFQMAGAAASLCHINQLIRRERRLEDYQIMAIPGGFSYGDDIAGGKVLANELKLKLGDDIRQFVEKGGLILGICNGFQIMARAGLLPDINNPDAPPLTLAANDSARFECRWVHMLVEKKSPCVFTRGMHNIYLPVAHGEGKVITDMRGLREINAVLYYTDENGSTQAGYPYNPNGSMNNIAGICDPTGRIFALMPHPERHVRFSQHPQWTRKKSCDFGDGLAIFQNAVKWAREI
ncbi:MAG: phosphoribosylformylglycinamidine synthase I [Dehalococcoidales bacterium]|nr:phosphoribosylformylglycinamidine synthase I [Dehalococcoidales bacterium]